MANAFKNFVRKLAVFILRLAIFLVIVALVLWAITAKWGTSQIAKALEDEPTADRYIEIKRGDQVFRTLSRKPEGVVGAASSPAPLIVIWRPDSQRVNEYTTYFWFFGYTKQIDKAVSKSDEPPLFKQ